MIIGVDQGIIEASYIAKINSVPLVLLSYEVNYHGEVSEELKKKEIDACKDISFAIVQDEIRGNHLCKEYNIQKEKLIYVPVAGREINIGLKTNFLHKRLHIDPKKNIALVLGSIAKWTMVEEIIESSQKWGNKWVLVLHNRYKNIEGKVNYQEKYKNNKNVVFSNEPTNDPDTLSKIIKSASLGFGFYNPTFDSSRTGNNIKYIGLSSGKIAAFLQNGVPIITNIGEPLKSLVLKNKIGKSVSSPVEITNEILESFTTQDFSQNCYNFFNTYLNLNDTIKPVLEKIKKISNNCQENKIFNQNEYENYIKFSLCILINHYKNLVDKTTYKYNKLQNGYSYKIGKLLLKPFYSLIKQ